MPVPSLFHQTAKKLPDKIAVEFEGKRITFKELDIIGNKVANALKKLGVSKGDRAAQFLPNCLELIYSIIGNFKNGSIVVPMNINFNEQEIEHIWGDPGEKEKKTERKSLLLRRNRPIYA